MMAKTITKYFAKTRKKTRNHTYETNYKFMTPILAKENCNQALVLKKICMKLLEQNRLIS